jgi:hypothetical protein
MRELYKKRAKLIQQQRDLVNKAKQEDRNLTQEEDGDFDTLDPISR